jgi:DNA polymerase lambda
MRGFWWKLEQLEAGMSDLPRDSPATVATTKSRSRTPGSKCRKAGDAEAKEEVKPCALDFVPTTALCVVPLGTEMSKQRIATWTRQMENLGARIVPRYAVDLAYIAVDPLVQLHKVMAWCGVSELSVNQYLISYSWIMDCLQSKQLRDASAYVIRTDPEPSLTPDVVPTTQESASSSGGNSMTPSTARKRARAEPASSEDEAERAMMAATRPTPPRTERVHSNDATLVKMREKYPWLQRASRLRTDEVQSDSWVKQNKHKFACQMSGQGLTNHNKALSDVFERLETIYTMLGDNWRAYSFKKVAGLLQNWPRVIKDDHEVSKIHGIGKKMQDKIREVLETGQLQRLVEFENNTQIQTMLAFSQIWGVGATTARILWNRGYRSIEDLRARGQADLNAQQLIGLAR